jgi:hypothetical protein
MARDVKRNNRERQLRKTGEGLSWDDLRVPLSATKRGGSKDPTFAVWLDDDDGSQGVFAYYFSGSQEMEVYFDAQLPHARKIPSDIVWHIHWSIPRDTSGEIGQTVVWGLEITSASIGAVFPATTLYTGTHTIDGTEENKHLLTNIATLSDSALGISAMSVCRLYRDVNADDYGDTVVGLEIDAHYVLDSLGSDELAAKTYT